MQALSSCLSVVPACLPACQTLHHDGHELEPSETISPTECFLLYVASVVVSYQSNRRVTRQQATFFVNLDIKNIMGGGVCKHLQKTPL